MLTPSMSSPKTNLKSSTSFGGKKKSKSSDQQTRSQEKSSKNLFRTEQIKLFDFSTTFKKSLDQLRKSENTSHTGHSPLSNNPSPNLSASKHKFGLRSASSLNSRK